MTQTDVANNVAGWNVMHVITTVLSAFTLPAGPVCRSYSGGMDGDDGLDGEDSVLQAGAGCIRQDSMQLPPLPRAPSGAVPAPRASPIDASDPAAPCAPSGSAVKAEAASPDQGCGATPTSTCAAAIPDALAMLPPPPTGLGSERDKLQHALMVQMQLQKMLMQQLQVRAPGGRHCSGAGALMGPHDLGAGRLRLPRRRWTIRAAVCCCGMLWQDR